MQATLALNGLILCKHIRAKVTGNWKLHVEVMSEQLPHSAASGHYLYVESPYIHFQSMIELETSHPHMYKNFLQTQYM